MSISNLPTTSLLTLALAVAPAVGCIFMSGCTLDDGQLAQTVPLVEDLDNGEEAECRVRIVNAHGNLTIEGRQPQQIEPLHAQLDPDDVARSSPGSAMFAWSNRPATEATPAPTLFFDPEGTLVVDGGCQSAIDAGLTCETDLNAWIPHRCAIEVELGTSETSLVVGFEQHLDFSAQSTGHVEIDHDGTAVLDVQAVRDELVFCGSGEFEFHVDGDVISCEDYALASQDNA